MKNWLSRAVASTALRGEDRRNRIARWSRWFPRTPVVDAERFQGADEPYPRHWRRFPERWGRVDPGDPAVEHRLLDALHDLPSRWREVVRMRDVEHRSPGRVSIDAGITDDQQRAILNRARALLRRRLADHPDEP